MSVRAVAFDIGGVLEVPTDTDLEDRWEQRLGLGPGEFFQRFRQSGLGRDANLGRVSEAEFVQALGRLYGLDQPTTEELLVDLWDWYVGELNTELADYFQRLRPRYPTALLSNAAAGGSLPWVALTTEPVIMTTVRLLTVWLLLRDGRLAELDVGEDVPEPRQGWFWLVGG